MFCFSDFTERPGISCLNPGKIRQGHSFTIHTGMYLSKRFQMGNNNLWYQKYLLVNSG
ncbi:MULTISPECIES: hypothetical protein [Chitinophagaceae]